MCSDLTRPARAGAALLLTAALALLAGCGKSGPPTPPFRAVPAPTKDLVVRQRGTHIFLSFHYPDTAPGGQALGGVSKVEVYQADIPPPVAPGSTDKKKQAPAAKPGTPATAAKAGAAAPTGSSATAGTTAGAGSGAAPGSSAIAGSSTTAAGSGAATAGSPPGGGPATGTAGGASGSAGSPATAAASSPTAGGSAGTLTGTASATTGTASTGTTATSATTATTATPPTTTPTAGGTTAPASAAAAAPLTTQDALEAPMLAKLAKVKLTLTTKDLASATVGNFLVIDLPLTETLPTTITPDQPTRDYSVRTFGPKGDRSAFSNQILLKVKVPPPPPDAVTATAQADGVMVEWKPVADAGSYAIYRRAASERASIKPLAGAPKTETRYLDQKAVFGQDYIYTVTTVDAKQELVESAIKAEVEVHYVDKFPPPVPGDLVIVAEVGKARLVWRQSDASDLAGYIVYRKAPGGDFARLTEKPIGRTTYVDDSSASGKTYVYRVTAIDQTGNESAPSPEVSVAIP
jgi:hypothetical protein